MPDKSTLRKRIEEWESDRNNRSKLIDWQFETAGARIKLKRLDPQITLC